MSWSWSFFHPSICLVIHPIQLKEVTPHPPLAAAATHSPLSSSSPTQLVSRSTDRCRYYVFLLFLQSCKRRKRTQPPNFFFLLFLQSHKRRKHTQPPDFFFSFVFAKPQTKETHPTTKLFFFLDGSVCCWKHHHHRRRIYFYFVKEVSGGSFGVDCVQVWEEMEWQRSSQTFG